MFHQTGPTASILLVLPNCKISNEKPQVKQTRPWGIPKCPTKYSERILLQMSNIITVKEGVEEKN